MTTTLFVTEPGSYVRTKNGRIVVAVGDKEAVELRPSQVSAVVIMTTAATITGPTLAMLLYEKIPIHFLTGNNQPLGTATPASQRNVQRRINQSHLLLEKGRRLEFAKAFIDGKLSNSERLLARLERNRTPGLFSTQRLHFATARNRIAKAKSTDAIFGIEGSAAATYFPAFGSALRCGLEFTERSKRPPRDPGNALLSFGYTLLVGDAVAALTAAGLDPAIGLLHVPDGSRPSLACDIAEEFRAPVVDALVAHLSGTRQLAAADFEDTDFGPRLSPAARKTFLKAYEERMTESAPKNRVPLRTALHDQAEKLSSCILEKTGYTPFAWRP